MSPLLLLLALSQAPADTATVRHWHLGENIRDATDRILSKPGWTFKRNDAKGSLFMSESGKYTIRLFVVEDIVVQILRFGPIGSALGSYVLKGAIQVDEYHWKSPREHALITRSYTGDMEMYRIEYLP